LRDGGGLIFPDHTKQSTAQVQGPVGPQGPAGPANTLTIGNVQTGNPGTAAGASITGTAPNQLLNLLLPQGPQGIQGPIGPQGIQGLKGSTGATGPQGLQGIQGVKGDTGPQGIQGLKGDKGDTGLQGPAGPQGEKGDTGATGSQGPKGDTGATGAQGLKGDTGSTGPQGIQGVQGVQGPKGDTGATGATGPQGPMGAGAVWRGPFDPLDQTGYATGNVVQYNGKAWIASDNVAKTCLSWGFRTLPIPPYTRIPFCEQYSTTWPSPETEEGAVWQLFASGGVGPTGPAGPQGTKGDKGDQGIQGTQGIQGPVGPQGPAGNAAIIGGNIKSDGTIGKGSGFTSRLSISPDNYPYYSITLPYGYDICTASLSTVGPHISLSFSVGSPNNTYLTINLLQLNRDGTLWVPQRGEFYFICTKSAN
jgi:hypothetical protein